MLSHKVVEYIVVAAVILAVGYVGYYYRDRTVAHEIGIAVRAKEAAMTELHNTAVAKCKANFDKALEESNEYQRQIAKRDSELSRLKRLYRNTVIPIAGSAAGVSSPGTNGAYAGDPGGKGNGAGLHGVSAETLFETAGRCERYRLRAMLCKTYLDRVYGSTPSSQ